MVRRGSPDKSVRPAWPSSACETALFDSGHIEDPESVASIVLQTFTTGF